MVLGIVDVVVVVVDVDVVPAAIPFAAEVEVVDDLTVVDVDGAVVAVTTFGQVTDNRPTTGGGASSGHGTGAVVVVVAARDVAGSTVVDVVDVVDGGVVVVVVDDVDVLVDDVVVLDAEHAVGRAILGSNCATAKFLPVPEGTFAYPAATI